LKEIQIKTKNAVFSAWEVGEGEPVLLLHGFPDNRNSFVPLMQNLASQGFHCVAPTLRGYEPQTITHASKLNISDLQLDILDWLDALQ